MEFSQEAQQINSIIAYSNKVVQLQDKTVNTPYFISKTQRIALTLTTLSSIDKSQILPLTIPDNVTMLIIGTGDKHIFLPAKQQVAIQSLGISVETMSNQKACHCYNLLLSDRRLVGLLLL